ncbi:MAG: hypothetical protein [Caudoviricetes sp.]|nr:MAG: hypothetical protein [Caudoviricetes sp.]
MGMSVNLYIVSEFKIGNVKKAKDIVKKIFKDEKWEDIPYDDIENCSGYIETDYISNGNNISINLSSDDLSWEFLSVNEGNFALCIDSRGPYIDLDCFEEHKKNIKELSDKIKEKYGFDYNISIQGAYN